MATALQTRLRRITAIARANPRDAIVRLEHLERQADLAGQIAVQLDALYLRYFTLERLGEATGLTIALTSGLALADQHLLPLQAARMLEALGRIHYTAGDYRDAMNYWTMCIDIGNSIEIENSAIEARIGLGQLYDALGDKKTAQRFHQDAAALMGNIDDPYLIAKVCINIAYNEQMLGNTASARRHLQQALDAAKAGSVPEFEAEVYLHLGRIERDEKNYTDAEAHTLQATTIAFNSNNAWAYSASLKSLGQILLDQHKFELAMMTYEQALDNARSVGSKPQQLECLEALSHLAELRGEPSAALAYARRQMTLEQALIDELKNQDQLRHLRQYDLSQKSPVELLLDLPSSAQIDGQTIDQSMDRIGDAALRILNIDHLVIWLHDAQAKELRCAVARVGASTSVTKGMLFGSWFDTALQRFNQGLHNERVFHNIRLHHAAPELVTMFRDTDLRSLLEITIQLHGRNAGLIYFGQTGQQRNWSNEDILFGRKIGELVERILGDDEHRQTMRMLQEHNLMLEQRVAERTKELEDAYRAIEKISLTDPLTGLHNRRFLDHQMETDVGLLMRRADFRHNHPSGQNPRLDMVFFLIDLDHFKVVNDTWGHASGDMVLMQLSQRLAHVFRKSDYLVRWGGEEFLVVARDIQRDYVAAAAERLREVVASQPFDIADHQTISVTCSIGFAEFPFLPAYADRLTWLQVVDIADRALYMSKQSGRNTWTGLNATDLTNPVQLVERVQKDLPEVIASGDLVVQRKELAAPATSTNRATVARQDQ